MAVKRNTLQKEIIRHTLGGMCTHPTAGEVFAEVHKSHPTISRSTVYRVLGQLAEEGQILRLGLPGSDDRYDGNIRRHGHVRCRLCGAVADIPPVAVGEPEDTAGYLLEDCAVAYCGLCPDCQRRQRESV
mgnify:FL=1